MRRNKICKAQKARSVGEGLTTFIKSKRERPVSCLRKTKRGSPFKREERKKEARGKIGGIEFRTGSGGMLAIPRRTKEREGGRKSQSAGAGGFVVSRSKPKGFVHPLYGHGGRAVWTVSSLKAPNFALQFTLKRWQFLKNYLQFSNMQTKNRKAITIDQWPEKETL